MCYTINHTKGTRHHDQGAFHYNSWDHGTMGGPHAMRSHTLDYMPSSLVLCMWDVISSRLRLPLPARGGRQAELHRPFSTQ